MEKRSFVPGGPRVSPLSFGASRIDPWRMRRRDAIQLLEVLNEGGVTTLHGARDESAHPYFCEAVRHFRKRCSDVSIEHVCRIRAEDGRITAAVEEELRDLGAARLDVVEWVTREEPTLATGETLAAEWESLHAAGKVGALAVRVGSPALARRVLAWSHVGGVAMTLGLGTLRMAPLLGHLAAFERSCIALGSLGVLVGVQSERLPGGLALDLEDPRARLRLALRFPLWSPAVATVVVSTSSVTHAREAIDALGDIQPDLAKFESIVSALTMTDEPAAARRAA